MSEELIFESLEPIVIPVKAGGKQYYLREADGAAAITFRNARIASHVYNDDGKLVRFQDPANVEPLLVSLCLFDENNIPVPQETLLKWKGSILTKLYDKAHKISALDEVDTVESIQKQIETLQKRLERIQKSGDIVKN